MNDFMKNLGTFTGRTPFELEDLQNSHYILNEGKTVQIHLIYEMRLLKCNFCNISCCIVPSNPKFFSVCHIPVEHI